MRSILASGIVLVISLQTSSKYTSTVARATLEQHGIMSKMNSIQTSMKDPNFYVQQYFTGTNSDGHFFVSIKMRMSRAQIFQMVLNSMGIHS